MAATDFSEAFLRDALAAVLAQRSTVESLFAAGIDEDRCREQVEPSIMALQALGDPSQGFFNALLFVGLSSAMRRKIGCSCRSQPGHQ